MFKKIFFIVTCIIILSFQTTYAVQYAPTVVPDLDIITGVSSHILNDLDNQTLEEYVPLETQEQIDELNGWGLEWSKIINIIIIVGVLLLILAIYLERHNIKNILKKK